MRDYYYLATPYTKYPRGLDAAYAEACGHAAWLISKGVPVFSPIAHTHGIAEQSDVDAKDGNYWLKADEPFMANAKGIIVVKMEGWDESAGVKHEIEYFQREGRPIVYLDPDAEELPPDLLFVFGEPVNNITEDILEEALRITTGARQIAYGSPDKNLAHTAKLWNALFGWEVSASQVAMAMILLKLSRETNQPKRDNPVDIAGYARALHICNEAAKGS